MHKSPRRMVRLPVRTALLQNVRLSALCHLRVRLPVRTALLQNGICPHQRVGGVRLPVRTALLQNVQSSSGNSLSGAITSQNGTAPKLVNVKSGLGYGAITSQNGTAPKPLPSPCRARCRAITSQNGTAPKLPPNHPGVIVVRLPVRTALLQNRWAKVIV